MNAYYEPHTIYIILLRTHMHIKKKKIKSGTLGWLSQLSVRLFVSAQVTISRFVSLSPKSGFSLTVWSLLEILSLPFSLCPSLTRAFSHVPLSQKLININKACIIMSMLQMRKLSPREVQRLAEESCY